LTGGAALPVVALLVVSGMYLAVNAKVADAGREVLTLEQRHEDLERVNAELTSLLAQTTSPQRMMERATSMGFRPAMPGEIEYVVVPGVIRPAEFVAPSPTISSQLGEAGLSPAFTETLGEWLTRWLVGGVGR
jgi:hypothetical protein